MFKRLCTSKGRPFAMPVAPHRTFMMDFWVWLSRFQSKDGSKSSLRPFGSITDQEIKAECGIDAELVYNNNLYWMPRFYQQPFLSQHFLEEIKKFKKKQVWHDIDVVALTQLVLIEATRDTTFDVSFNFKASPSQQC